MFWYGQHKLDLIFVVIGVVVVVFLVVIGIVVVVFLLCPEFPGGQNMAGHHTGSSGPFDALAVGQRCSLMGMPSPT